MSYLLDDKIKLEATPQLSAFGRLRVSEPRLLGEYRYMYGSGTTIEVVDKLAGSGQLVKDQARTCYHATVGTDSGALALRQTKQYHPYISGTTNFAMMTFVMDQSKIGLTQSIGLYDDLNGFIFRVRDGVAEVVIRKNGVDTEIVSQSQWNGDRLDGTKSKTNKSGVLADWTKAQILFIDYQWLGVGKVRFCFVHGDENVVAHTFYHANIVTEAYTFQPSLPCRWEVKNTAVTTSTSSMMIICAVVHREGADYETGFSRSVSTDGTGVAVTAANAVNGKGLIAIRLKNVLEGKQNHAFARLKQFTLYTNNDVNYKIVILSGAAAIANTPTWLDVPGYGWCDYIKDFTLAPTWNAGEDYQVLLDDFVTGGNGSQSGQTAIGTFDNRSASIFQNYDATDSMILAVIAYRLSADATVRAGLSWIEIK